MKRNFIARGNSSSNARKRKKRSNRIQTHSQNQQTEKSSQKELSESLSDGSEKRFQVQENAIFSNRSSLKNNATERNNEPELESSEEIEDNILDDHDLESDFSNDQSELLRNLQESSSNSRLNVKSKLDRALESQNQVIRERLERISPHVVKTSRKTYMAAGIIAAPACSIPQTLEEKWHSVLNSQPPKFLQGREARMVVGKTRKRRMTSTGRVVKTAYRSLPVSIDNCSDMFTIYETEQDAAAKRGHAMTAWNQFRYAIGQFVRMAIANGAVKNPDILWKEGELFSLATNLSLFKCFTNYYTIEGTSGTVVNKATQMLLFTKHADLHFKTLGAEGNAQTGHVGKCHQFLRRTANANKLETRRQAGIRREESQRAKEGRLVLPSDFENLSHEALRACKAMKKDMSEMIKRRVKEGKESSSIAAFISIMERSSGFVDKWNIHFINVLILFGCGQRPQVFTILEKMTRFDVDEMFSSLKENRNLPLRIKISPHEKRPRTLDIPHVLFDPKILPSVKFHITFILPYVYSKFKIEPSDPRREFLLLHTRSGNVLMSKSITSTLRRFLVSVDPELGAISTMTIRSCYASNMIARFREGKQRFGVDEETFVEYLAKAMNTSKEQIEETYASACQEEYTASVSRCLGIIKDQEYEKDDSSSESDDSDKSCPDEEDEDTIYVRNASPLCTGMNERRHRPVAVNDESDKRCTDE
eukprot:IDg2397t1